MAFESLQVNPKGTIVAVRVYSESLHARASVTSLHYFVVFELSSDGQTSYCRYLFVSERQCIHADKDQGLQSDEFLAAGSTG